MAYSDYGGYAYRNGVRVEDRSDFSLTPQGNLGIPGMWPGFAAIARGLSAEEASKREGPNGHAVIGDGPIMVGLYKQSTLMFWRGFAKLEDKDVYAPEDVSSWTSPEGKVYTYADTDKFTSSREPCCTEIDGHKITIYWLIDDNHYQYVEMIQPDGARWHAWSGYGVGAGLEDAGYGYSTDERDGTLCELFEKPQ